MFSRFTVQKTLTLAAGLLLFAGPALSDPWNKKTYVTFPDSIELPGQVTLPAGTYTMKLVDSSSNRNIVMVQNRDENRVFATFFTVPKYREEPAEKTIISFYETPGSQPRFIRAWFYPGDTTGREFIYSKQRTRYIASLRNGSFPAAQTQQVVASTATPQTESPVTESSSTPATVHEQERTAGGGDTPAVENAAPAVTESDAPAEPPAPAPAVDIPEPAESAAADQAPAAPTPQELPKTASELPLIVMGGLLMFGSAGLLRLRRER